MIFSVVFSQEDKDTLAPTRLILNNTAEFLPHFAVTLNAGTSVFTSTYRPFRGNVVLSIDELAEIDYSSDGQAENVFGNAKPMNSWGMKFKILNAKEVRPAVALRVQSSIDWNREDLWTQDLQQNTPSLYRQGLAGSQYEYRLTTIDLVFTERIQRSLIINGGVGFQEIQSRNLWIFPTVAPPAYNGYHNPDVVRNLLLTAFFSGVVQIDSSFSAIAEIQSIPLLTPSITALNLSVEQSYLGSLGIRYSPTTYLVLDGSLAYHTDQSDQAYMEARIGVSALIGNQ
jgi:hypothetical protein